MSLIQAIEDARERLHISKEELATRTGKRRESVSRLLNAEAANPTLDTVSELLAALGVTADVTLRKSADGEAPITVHTDL